MIKHIIVDLDADPFVPDSWEVFKHHRMGEFDWDPERVQLYLSQKQKDGSYSRGEELREELKDKKPFNANLLDYLLKYPHLIPEEWQSKAICFWGTTYRDSAGRLFVRCLCWDGSRWYWSCRWVAFDFYSDTPAVCLAS